MAFADALREMLYQLNPITKVEPYWDESELGWTQYARAHTYRVQDIVDKHGWEEAKKIGDVRELLQRLGTDAGRNVLGDNIWVDTCFRKAEDGQRYFLTDCRYPNEAEAVKSRSGYMVRVNRPGFGPINDHISEVGLDGYEFDFVIDNDGSLDDLRGKVLNFLESTGL